ncbi:MAG: hypothetical protein V1722_03635 [Candidatus Micrarchaeota archaeon]
MMQPILEAIAEIHRRRVLPPEFYEMEIPKGPFRFIRTFRIASEKDTSVTIALRDHPIVQAIHYDTEVFTPTHEPTLLQKPRRLFQIQLLKNKPVDEKLVKALKAAGYRLSKKQRGSRWDSQVYLVKKGLFTVGKLNGTIRSALTQEGIEYITAEEKHAKKLTEIFIAQSQAQ